MEYNITIEKQGQTAIEKIEVSNGFHTLIYRFTKEEQVSFYSQCTQTYSYYVAEVSKQLEAWKWGEVYFTTTPPDYQAMLEEELDKLKKLNKYTPRYDFSHIVNNGEFNMDMAGVFLKILEPYPEQQQTATVALERIRWLAEHIKSTKEEQVVPPPKPEDNLDSKELAFLCHMTKELKLKSPLKLHINYGDKLKFTTNQVLFALYQYCEEENFICAKSVQCFAEKLHPLIVPNLTPNSIQQRIGRANKENGMTFIGESRLKDLTYRILMDNMGWKEHIARNKFRKWEGLYDLVKKAAQKFGMTEQSNDKV